MIIKQKLHFRNSRIINYRKNHTLAETAAKFNMTAERVRQIHFIKHKKFCTKHNRSFYNRCSYCLGENYKNVLRFATYAFVLNEAKKEKKNRKRDYLSVQRRVYLVQRLRNTHGHSFKTISIMLDRHLSTIKSLYAKSI